MWCSCLILQQITGRRLWVAEGPPGGLAGGLYPAALRLHLCSGSQSGLLPELCPRHGHANLLTRLHVSSGCTSADVTVTAGLVWPWGQPVLLLCSFCSHAAGQLSSPAKAHCSIHLFLGFGINAGSRDSDIQRSHHFCSHHSSLGWGSSPFTCEGQGLKCSSGTAKWGMLNGLPGR